MTSARRTAAAVGLALIAAVVVIQATVSSASDAPPRLGPGVVRVDVRIDKSRFEPRRLEVVEGTTVRFVVHNDDPIGHELIIGDDGVHARHERGREAAHPPVPGEVSVPPLATAETTFVFDEVGTVTFACHLPGHLAYGMRGEVVVVASAS